MARRAHRLLCGGFKRELEAFHDAVVSGVPPRTGGVDALRDVALSQAIVTSHVEGVAVQAPTALAVTALPERSLA